MKTKNHLSATPPISLDELDSSAIDRRRALSSILTETDHSPKKPIANRRRALGVILGAAAGAMTMTTPSSEAKAYEPFEVKGVSINTSAVVGLPPLKVAGLALPNLRVAGEFRYFSSDNFVDGKLTGTIPFVSKPEGFASVEGGFGSPFSGKINGGAVTASLAGGYALHSLLTVDAKTTAQIPTNTPKNFNILNDLVFRVPLVSENKTGVILGLEAHTDSNSLTTLLSLGLQAALQVKLHGECGDNESRINLLKIGVAYEPYHRIASIPTGYYSQFKIGVDFFSGSLPCGNTPVPYKGHN